jgi:hypothetical protein
MLQIQLFVSDAGQPQTHLWGWYQCIPGRWSLRRVLLNSSVAAASLGDFLAGTTKKTLSWPVYLVWFWSNTPAHSTHKQAAQSEAAVSADV